MPAGSLLTLLALVRLTAAGQSQGVGTIVPYRPGPTGRSGPSHCTQVRHKAQHATQNADDPPLVLQKDNWVKSGTFLKRQIYVLLLKYYLIWKQMSCRALLQVNEGVNNRKRPMGCFTNEHQFDGFRRANAIGKE